MKKIIPVLALFIAAFAACKKDKAIVPQQSVVGKWKFTKMEERDFNNGTVVFDTTLIIRATNAFLQFNADGTGHATVWTMSTAATPTSTQPIGDFNYTVSGDVLTIAGRVADGITDHLSFNGDEMLITVRIEDNEVPTRYADIIEYYSKQ
ncbi:hypothetical protein ACFS5N_01730 [Mucilaginibacter ximonensis]|uniref:Lipocalin-like domain-containing protein n=1 Tax=Mucilaginibacter ximonensis TaxID=538021 RepID=A0ABW5Y763_9SPHI